MLLVGLNASLRLQRQRPAAVKQRLRTRTSKQMPSSNLLQNLSNFVKGDFRSLQAHHIFSILAQRIASCPPAWVSHARTNLATHKTQSKLKPSSMELCADNRADALRVCRLPNPGAAKGSDIICHEQLVVQIRTLEGRLKMTKYS